MKTPRIADDANFGGGERSVHGKWCEGYEEGVLSQ
jgi:hypothetical protein